MKRERSWEETKWSAWRANGAPSRQNRWENLIFRIQTGKLQNTKQQILPTCQTILIGCFWESCVSHSSCRLINRSILYANVQVLLAVMAVWLSWQHISNTGLTYLLTPRSRVVLEKLTGSQLLKKFLSFYGTRRFITTFTNPPTLSLSWVSSTQSIPPLPADPS